MIWPDWKTEAVAIIASGPSTLNANLEQLRDGFKVVVIGINVDLYPSANVVYSCDGNWWHHRKGLDAFHGLKLTNDGPAASRYRLGKVDVQANVDRLLFKQTGVIGSGGCSGFQALNLAAQFGAKRIMLIGFDMNQNDKHEQPHWYGRNTWPNSSNPSWRDFDRWRVALDLAAHDLDQRGVQAINVSERSTLQHYPKMTFQRAVECLRH